MHVAMQVLMALTATVLLLSAIVHFSDSVDAIVQGLDTPPKHFSIHMEVLHDTTDKPEDPKTSTILKQIYTALGTDVSKSDLSDGSVHVTVAYEGKTIEDGSYVPMVKASKAPTVKVTDEKQKDGVYYTWILIDIDAPSPTDPSHSPFLHEIIANLDATKKQSPLVIVSHYPVSPPTGEHRYIGLLFTQHGLADKTALRGYEAKFGDAKNRMNFDVKEYVDREGLTYVKRTYFFSRPQKTTF